MPRIDQTLVDTGPLVAILSASDSHHRACADELRRHQNALLTCWPVLAEVGWLVRRESAGVSRLFQLIEAGVIEIVDLDPGAVSWIRQFVEQYSSIRADVADAA